VSYWQTMPPSGVMVQSLGPHGSGPESPGVLQHATAGPAGVGDTAQRPDAHVSPFAGHRMLRMPKGREHAKIATPP
jgi:hypothetical protein